MTKFYNEPEFKVVITNSEDVITTSGETTYEPDSFETENIPFPQLGV